MLTKFIIRIDKMMGYNRITCFIIMNFLLNGGEHGKPFSNFTYWSCHLFLFTAKTLKRLFPQVNLKVNYIKQIQRYLLDNHLYWLANGKPYSHQKWHFLNSLELHAAYEKQLAVIGKRDTIVVSVSRG